MTTPPDSNANQLKTIYHYTTRAGLQGILESNTLWASHSQFLNDRAELNYAHGLVTAELERRIAKCDGTEEDGTAKTECEALLHKLDKRFSATPSTSSVSGDTPYIVSLSTDGDSLGMWRSYAGGDGVAIGFDTETLLEYLDRSGADYEHDSAWDPLVNNGLTASLQTVAYGPGQVGDLTDTLLASNQARDEWSVSTDATLLGGVKHPSYTYEQEVRLIVSPDGCLETPRFLRAGNHHFVPYIKLKFPESAICSITVGPGAYQNRDVEALKLFLSPSGKGPDHCFDEITATDIPYIP